MHPGFYYRWKAARAAACGEAHPGWEGQRPDAGGPQGWWAGSRETPGAGATFGVRRPLRFMAHRLGLDDNQIQELARILNDIKTERAQVEVDDRRAVSQFADSLDADAFDSAKAEAAIRARVESTERLERAVLGVLQRTHAMLNREQRSTLAYMLRSGQLTI